jgi:hypothetical protein
MRTLAVFLLAVAANASAAAGAGCSESVTWRIKPSDRGSPVAAEIRCGGDKFWVVKSARGTELAKMPVPALAAGETFNYGECVARETLHHDIVAMVKHQPGQEWSSEVSQAWKIRGTGPYFTPLRVRGIRCRNVN